jgi:hypothetical protein
MSQRVLPPARVGPSRSNREAKQRNFPHTRFRRLATIVSLGFPAIIVVTLAGGSGVGKDEKAGVKKEEKSTGRVVE